MIMATTENNGRVTYGLTGSVIDTQPTAATTVQARFQRSPFLPLRKITCSLHGGVLLLRGRVPTYYLKQLAQTIGTSTEGVQQVINDLLVDFPERS